MTRKPEAEIVYGIHPIAEALTGPRRCLNLYVKDEGGERASLVSQARRQGIRVRILSLAELGKMAKGGNHQGAVAEFEAFRYAELHDLLKNAGSDGEPLIVVLDSIKDPGNLGAILRTAAAAGAQGVVLAADRAVGVTPAVVRASAGAADRISVARVVNIARALETLKQYGFWIYGADSEGTASLWQTDFRGPTALVFGEEGKGMRPLVRKSCDRICNIPMPGRFESLNVSAAAAVLLFEAVRQRSG